MPVATSALHETAAALVAPAKGILAADESPATMSRRLEAAGIPASARHRRDYRELLVGAPGLASTVSGVILSTETLDQRTADGTPFGTACAQRGLLPGVKVDTGTARMPNHGYGLVTEGLDGLRERVLQYRAQGAVFAKWRAVLAPLGLDARTVRCNAHALARYAAVCQEAGVVPIVEPEVLMDGDHPVAVCQAVTGNALGVVVDELTAMGVDLRGVVLKPNMVVSGLGSGVVDEPDEVARRTLRVLRAEVPDMVAGVAFLSGGQSTHRACANLTAITALAAEQRAAGDGPAWPLTFSFGRALVDEALRTWAGDPARVPAAQHTLLDACHHASTALGPGIS